MPNTVDLLLLIQHHWISRQIKQYSVYALVLTLLSCAGQRPNFAQNDLNQNSRRTIVAAALNMQGKPYRYGGSTPNGFDCSGLVQYAYKQAGIKLPRTTYKQYRASQAVYLNRIQPGDLVFYRINNSLVSHVGIYIGKGQFIHAPKTGKSVTIERIKHSFWQKRFVGAGNMFP